MKMNNTSIIAVETIINKKLELLDKAMGHLPSDMQNTARGLQTQVLTSLRDTLDHYLKNDRSPKESTIKKIDLD